MLLFFSREINEGVFCWRVPAKRSAQLCSAAARARAILSARALELLHTATIRTSLQTKLYKGSLYNIIGLKNFPLEL